MGKTLVLGWLVVLGCRGYDAMGITDASSDGPPGTYRIIVSVSGLAGTVVLQNNGGDDLTIMTNGPASFSTALAMGAHYDVTVKTQPPAQTCVVANGAGIVASADVTNIAVTCSSDLGIKCGATFCAIGDTCCFATQVCSSVTACATSVALACDDTADCAGAQGTICCGRLNNGGSVRDALCLTQASCATSAMFEVLCDPSVPGGDPACIAATSCKAALRFSGYDSCQ